MLLLFALLSACSSTSYWEDDNPDGCTDGVDNDEDYYVDCDDDDCEYDDACDSDSGTSSGSGRYVTCNDGTESPSCYTCSTGCCSGHGGCSD